MDAPTGIITTVVGNGTWGYNSDGIPATSASLAELEEEHGGEEDDGADHDGYIT